MKAKDSCPFIGVDDDTATGYKVHAGGGGLGRKDKKFSLDHIEFERTTIHASRNIKTDRHIIPI